MKLYTNVLAFALYYPLALNQLKKCINFDQTGFMEGRVAPDNVRRQLHIIEKAGAMLLVNDSDVI